MTESRWDYLALPTSAPDLQTFIKTINYSHMMPTRYNLAEVDLKNTVTTEALENSEAKKSANKVRFGPMQLLVHCKRKLAYQMRMQTVWPTLF